MADSGGSGWSLHIRHLVGVIAIVGGFVGLGMFFAGFSGASGDAPTVETTPRLPSPEGAPPRGGARVLDPGGGAPWTNLSAAERSRAIELATNSRRVTALAGGSPVAVEDVSRWFDGEVTRTNIGAVVMVVFDRAVDAPSGSLVHTRPALPDAATGGRPYTQEDDPYQYRGLTSLFVFVDLQHDAVAGIKPGPGALQLDRAGRPPRPTTAGE